jgi:hypothetical protein
VGSAEGIRRLGDVAETVNDPLKLEQMAEVLRQQARVTYKGQPLPPTVRGLLSAIERRKAGLISASFETKAGLTKTKHDQRVALPVDEDASPSRPDSPRVEQTPPIVSPPRPVEQSPSNDSPARPVEQTPPNTSPTPPVEQTPPNTSPTRPVEQTPPNTSPTPPVEQGQPDRGTPVEEGGPVVATVKGVGFGGNYNLRNKADRDRFIQEITSTRFNIRLKDYEESFTAAVSGLADTEFGEVRKALAAKAAVFTKPAKEQLKSYERFTNWSQSGGPLYGSVEMKRVDLAAVPDGPSEKAEHKERKYELPLTISDRIESDPVRSAKATAIATHIANALHHNKVHGVDLRQVVKLRDGTNELYHLNIHIPKAKASTDPPAEIKVTVDTVKVDTVVAGEVVDFTKLDPGLSGRILQMSGDLYPDRNAKEDRKPTHIRSKEWLTTDTEVLKSAIDLIPKEHWNLLPSLQFIRVSALPGQGNTAPAEYYPTNPPVICISDAVLDRNNPEYLYNKASDKVLPRAVRMIAHEIGHAVSMEKWRQAALRYRDDPDKSLVELNSLGGTAGIKTTANAALGTFIEKGEFVTDYAASEELEEKKRDKACAELFAEAYSLWVTDRSYMTENHPAMANYFATFADEKS